MSGRVGTEATKQLIEDGARTGQGRPWAYPACRRTTTRRLLRHPHDRGRRQNAKGNRSKVSSAGGVRTGQ
jgi:hypothetical protein